MAALASSSYIIHWPRAVARLSSATWRARYRGAHRERGAGGKKNEKKPRGDKNARLAAAYIYLWKCTFISAMAVYSGASSRESQRFSYSPILFIIFRVRVYIRDYL